MFTEAMSNINLGVGLPQAQIADSVCLMQFLDSCTWQGSMAILMELMPGGNLMQAIADFSWTWNAAAMAWALDIAMGLCYLHSRSIAHLDLKSPNILLR